MITMNWTPICLNLTVLLKCLEMIFSVIWRYINKTEFNWTEVAHLRCRTVGSQNDDALNLFKRCFALLGWVSFCMKYCINAVWHGGDQPVALLRCNGSPGCLIAAFRSSALLGLVSLIFLLTISQRFSMGFRSGDFAGQSSTVTPWSFNQLLVPLSVWPGAMVLLGN